MRRTVPLVIAFTVGVILLFQYFNPAFFTVFELSLKWSPIIVGVTAYLGIVSFLRHHWTKTRRKAPDWAFSVASLVAFAVMTIAGFWGDLPKLWGGGYPEIAPTWPQVSFEDHPSDRGGVIRMRWKLENDLEGIRKFEVHRRPAGGDAEYVKVRVIAGDEHKIGSPVTNRENLGRPNDPVLANGEFDSGLEGWTATDGVETREDEYRKTYAVIPAGGSLTSPAATLEPGARLRFTAIARGVAEGAKLLIDVVADGRDEPLFSVEAPALDPEVWIDVKPKPLEQDILPVDGAKTMVRLRLRAEGAGVAVDVILVRPVLVEFMLGFTDAAPYNNEEEFAHYGEVAEILEGNTVFEIGLAGWTYDEDAGIERVARDDWAGGVFHKLFHDLPPTGGYCVRLPAGQTIESPTASRPLDPLNEPYRFRLRGWGRGGESGLRAEVLAGRQVLGSITWPAGSGWERKEVLVDAPPRADSPELRVRYTATGESGSAGVDDLTLLAVKEHPIAGEEYEYKVVALGADGGALKTVESGPIAGTWEMIGNWENRNGLYQWLFYYLLVPMEATMFALLAFFIASAAFRAFRARSFEATLLLVAAIFVMIGRVPIGEWLWSPLGDFADWIMEYPNGGAKRAIMIGVGLGMAATSLKLMLGLERAYLGKG